MQISVTVNGLCPGGEHVNLTLTSGAQSRPVTIMRADLLAKPRAIADVLDALIPLLRQRVLESGATSNAQRRAAIESAPFHI